MKKIIINAPLLSASGYGEMSRFALSVLREHEDKFDIYVNVLNWGQTGWLFEENEEYEFIKSLRVKTEQYTQANGGNSQFDMSLQITIPNEWKRMAPVNIGYTAGIETTHISPAWLEPSNQMDKIIVISEHAKTIFQNTSFQDQVGNTFKVTTPIEVVHFPFKKLEDAKIDLDFQNTTENKILLRSGDNRIVKFTFTYNPEFIEENMIFFFRDGTTKGVGEVLRITDNLDGFDFNSI